MDELLDFILKEKQTMEELNTSPYVLIDKIIERLKMTKKEQKRLYDTQNVPIDEETLRNQRMESN